ncbi:MAG: TonB-dependent receptor [Deltaproteobacteria bacterium]|nr:TonB-dependent receptor [Deltaproteobacteria bacterium]
MKNLLSCAAVLLVFMLFVLPVPIFAQEESDAITMEETVVTASRDKEDVRRIPANVSVITAKDIEGSGATSIVEVLENLESISFRTFSGNPSQAVIDMRGFGGDNPHGKTLVMLDGRRLNRPDQASVNWFQIPINNVERIEVVRGASSVLYGDSAVAGVINIITKRGKGKPEINASVIAGSYGLHDERVGITGSYDKYSYALTGENQKVFGYRERSKFASKGAGLNLGYECSDYFDIFLGVSFNRTDFEMPGCLKKTEMEQDRRQAGNPNDDASNEYSNINLKMESFLGDSGRLDVNFMYGNKNITADYASYSSYSVVDIDTYGIMPKYILEKDILGHGNKLILGLDYYHENLDVDKYSDREKTLKTSTAELTKNSLGYYLRDEFNILKELILSAGYRTERAEIKGNNILSTGTMPFDSKKTHTGEAYEAGLVYLIGEKSKVFTKYAQVYRYPFTDEQASYYIGTPAFLTDLEKEKGKSYEIGTQFYPRENLKIGLTLFRIDMEDEIVWNDIASRNENLDKTRHEGVEFAMSYKLEDLAKIYGNFTYHDAEFRNGTYVGKKVPLVPEEMANAGLEIYLPYALILSPEVRYVGKSYLGGDSDNSTEQLDDYTIYNLFLRYEPELDDLKISAFFGVENLTDEKYSTMGYDREKYGSPNVYYPSPGVTVKGGISIGF